MRGRPFKKGQSGNPGGRPKVLGDIQALAREKSPRMIEILEDIADNAKSHPQARVAAARELLDRGFGKPLQTTALATMEINNRAEDYTDDELATIIAQAQCVSVKPAAKQEEQCTVREFGPVDGSKH